MKRVGKRIHFGATGHDLYVDAPLTNLVMNYRPENLIADMIAPIVDVPRQSGNIIMFNQADIMRREATGRAPGTQAKRITKNVSSVYFNCNNYALMDGVTVEDRANADPIYVSRMFDNRAMLIADKLALDWEVRVANQVTSGTNVGSYAAVASAWTESRNGYSNPIGDINTAIDNVYYATGFRPNSIVMGVKAWHALRRHIDVRDIVNGTNNGGGFPNTNAVKDLFEVDNFLIGGGFQNTAAENIAQSLSTIWGGNVLVYYKAPNPNQERPSFMYTHRWASPGLPNMTVERHPYDTKLKTDDIEVGYYQDENITSKPLGFLLTGAAT